jgi:hypothetical protein
MVPDAPPAAVAASSPAGAATPATPRFAVGAMTGDGARELVRSLERMDADLAELRAEIDRIRRHLGAGQPTAGSPR